MKDPDYEEIEGYVESHPQYLEAWCEYSEATGCSMARVFSTLYNIGADSYEWSNTIRDIGKDI